MSLVYIVSIQYANLNFFKIVCFKSKCAVCSLPF